MGKKGISQEKGRMMMHERTDSEQWTVWSIISDQ